MLTIKKRVVCHAVLLLAGLGLLAGCMPSGPRALLQGQRLIEQGDYARAAGKLRMATSILTTNAEAWNYLAIACHHLDERDEAARAYQRALSLNHDLSEAHYNLGCLWLEQNKLEAARTEFTAYTLRRGNVPEGFLKLAAAQARARDFSAAERSFNDVLRLSPQNPDALNGLGLLRLQQRRPAEAEQFFAAAIRQQPGYRPAMLNSAIVSHQYLGDLPGALRKYRAWLALTPPPSNAAPVAALVRQIEQELSAPQRLAPIAKTPAPAATNPPPARPSPAAVTRPLAAPKVEPLAVAPKPTPATNSPRPAATPIPSPAPPPAPPIQVVQLTPDPVVKPAQDVAPKPAPIAKPPTAPPVATSSAPVAAVESKPAKRGFLDRVNPVNIFRSEPKPPIRPTPLPPPKETAAPSQALPSGTAHSPASAATANRYIYRSPAKPEAGDREEARRLFDLGLEAQRTRRLNDAIQLYRQAAQQDPGFFEAQFYLAFAATEARNLPVALTAYEYALAINPNDASARYNFALVLKQANCAADAATELERLLATHPSEARAHLALANIYAQQLRQPSLARQHYLKVLELEPRSPEANTIGYWLEAHPQ